MHNGGWQLRLRPSESLPPMAWILCARAPVAEVTHGRLVRATDAGIFEGTWVGDGDDLGPLRSTTPFGSGVVADGDSLYVIPPGHMLEGVYVCRREGEVVASNSLAGLLEACGLELDPNVAYPALLNESVDGIMHTTIPTTSTPIETCFHDNLRIGLDGRVDVVPKRREAPFTTFSEYRSRLSGALASALANAPGYEPVVTISSGYDGAAVAVLAAELGCRHAVTIGEGKPVRGSTSLSDSGESVGRRLGMEVNVISRLAYQRREDLPEAEFLATGFSGEEVVLSGIEPELGGRTLLSAFYGDGMWWLNRPPRPVLWRSDQSGSSLGEWRLRVGFIHVPLPCFGGHDYRATQRISRSPEMRPWVLGRRYDKPIPRRILEEADIPRGTFGEVKRAASASIHVDGPAALAPATLASLEAFAASEGRHFTFEHRSFPLWDRALLKLFRKLDVESLAWRVEQRKFRLGVLEPSFGSLLLRWSLGVVRSRYQTPSVSRIDSNLSTRSNAPIEISITPAITSEVDLSQQIRSALDLAQPSIERAGLTLTVDVPDRLSARANPDHLAQVLANLLSNAVRYSPPGGSIVVRAERRPADLLVSVINSGEGIPPAELGRVFERFYRVEKSRDRARGGAGIGLAIVKQLVEAAGGKVGADTSEGSTRFWFSLSA